MPFPDDTLREHVRNILQQVFTGPAPEATTTRITEESRDARCNLNLAPHITEHAPQSPHILQEEDQGESRKEHPHLPHLELVLHYRL